jgi:hypothetical protein
VKAFEDWLAHSPTGSLFKISAAAVVVNWLNPQDKRYGDKGTDSDS